MRLLFILVVVALLLLAACKREMDTCESLAGECKDACLKGEEVQLRPAECEGGKVCCFRNTR